MTEFVIPLNVDGLRSKASVNQYVVDEVFPIRLLPAKIQECRASFRSKGPLAINSSFDAIYSVLKHFDSVEPEIKEDVWDIVVKAVSAHSSLLVEVLDLPNADTNIKQQHLMAVKMATYLLCQFCDILENHATDKTAATTGGKGGRKKVKLTADFAGHLDWECERERAVRALLQLLNLNIQRLWDPPVVEEEFISLVSGICYKILENPNINKNKTTRDTVFQLIGVMVKKYNHALSCSLKLVQLLGQCGEHLAPPLAAAVTTIATDFGSRTVVGDIMREIGRMDVRDLARDTSGTRSYAQFLVELAERVPALMLPNISVLLSLLDAESYMMRNAVFGVLGEMLVRVLSKEDLPDKDKKMREQFLDKLEDHVHDVHAFCRSRALQVWLHIVQEKCLPMARQATLLSLVSGRIHDKSSQVRKYALQLLTALLLNNPFAAKLPIDELQGQYDAEKKKLDEMTPPPEPSRQESVTSAAEAEWNQIEAELKTAVRNIINSDEAAPEDEEAIEIADDDTPDRVQKQIVYLLRSKDYRMAVRLLAAGVDAFPDSALLGPSLAPPATPRGDPDDSTVTDSNERSKAENFIYRFKVIFVGDSLHEKLSLGPEGEEEEEAGASTKTARETSARAKQQVLVAYLKDSLAFVRRLQEALPAVVQLLGSKSATDVLEAVAFFVAGFEFGVANVMPGIRRMLVLVWSKEASVRDAVVEAYKRLYTRPVDAQTPRARAAAIVSSLTALTLGASMGDLTSLEQLVVEFVSSGELDSETIKVLWERFAKKLPGTTDAESRAALQLLAMAAGAEVDIVRSNVDVLVEEGLGPRAPTDFLLAADTCAALAKLAGSKKKKAGEYDVQFRYPQDHKMFERMSKLLIDGVTALHQDHYLPLAERAVDVVYKMAEKPDAIVGAIIKTILTNTIMAAGGDAGAVPAAVLARFLALAGHAAFRQLVHLDVATLGELKRRHALQDAAKEKEQEQSSKRKSAAGSKSSSSEPSPEEELGLAGAAAEDAEVEFIRRITETQIVTSSSSPDDAGAGTSAGNLLAATVSPLVVAVCTDHARFSDPQLQAAASLALAKCMLVSSEFCEEHLQLLFTILEKSPHALIRANTIVALGDLTFRFPNLIEPWTPNLYARLRDPSPQVRKNCLMVLSHLILNDMVKVKGQISELATCIVDEDDDRIAGLAKLFFHELAKKGNAIYNIMPDMVSRLSDPDVGVAQEDQFRVIMKYLFQFIQKDRQCESLVEKLCHRFRATRTERQPRDLAYCLSLLSYSDKSIRKLQENFTCFADKLHDPDVYNSFTVVISGAKKFAKQETKSAIEEFESRLEKVHERGVEDEEAAQNAAKAAAGRKQGLKGRNRGTPTPARRRRRGTMTTAASRTPNALLTPAERAAAAAGDNEDDEDDFHPAGTSRSQKPQRRPGRKQKPKLVLSSDDDSDMELFEPDKGGTKDPVDSDSENTNPTSSSSSTSSSRSPATGVGGGSPDIHGKPRCKQTAGGKTAMPRRGHIR